MLRGAASPFVPLGSRLCDCAAFDAYGDDWHARVVTTCLERLATRKNGETIGVTDRERLVAMLSPPSAATGAAASIAFGRVQPAHRSIATLLDPVASDRSSADLLDELRADR